VPPVFQAFFVRRQHVILLTAALSRPPRPVLRGPSALMVVYIGRPASLLTVGYIAHVR
jgi:hypothetical protein